MRIAVAGLGYVGLAAAVLLAQKHSVIAVDVLQHKAEQVNRRISPISDPYIERFFAERSLDLVALTEPKKAYSDAELVIIATPTDYDPERNSFDTSSVESVIEQVLAVNDRAVIVIKSTVPVGFTEDMIRKTGYKRILFSPEFLREGRALYDSLNPSRIIVGATDEAHSSAEMFALLSGVPDATSCTPSSATSFSASNSNSSLGSRRKIICSSFSGLIGFGRNASKPSARYISFAPVMAFAVKATTGVLTHR